MFEVLRPTSWSGTKRDWWKWEQIIQSVLWSIFCLFLFYIHFFGFGLILFPTFRSISSLVLPFCFASLGKWTYFRFKYEEDNTIYSNSSPISFHSFKLKRHFTKLIELTIEIGKFLNNFGRTFFHKDTFCLTTFQNTKYKWVNVHFVLTNMGKKLEISPKSSIEMPILRSKIVNLSNENIFLYALHSNSPIKFGVQIQEDFIWILKYHAT